MLFQKQLFLRRNHWCQLLQIAYHQELHTAERQVVALAVLAKHRVDGVEQIAAHHTDFIDDQQVDASDDVSPLPKVVPGIYGEKGSWKNE